jgi:DnaJ-class molecular chaperone
MSWTNTLPEPHGKPLKKCSRCRGTGAITVPGMTRPERCPRCDGLGKVAK